MTDTELEKSISKLLLRYKQVKVKFDSYNVGLEEGVSCVKKLKAVPLKGFKKILEKHAKQKNKIDLVTSIKVEMTNMKYEFNKTCYELVLKDKSFEDDINVIQKEIDSYYDEILICDNYENLKNTLDVVYYKIYDDHNFFSRKRLGIQCIDFFKQIENIFTLGDGILYIIFDLIMFLLKYINIVEWLKVFLEKCSSARYPKYVWSRLGTDLFIFAKFTFVLWLWGTKNNSWYYTFAVWYLLVSNVYTYFYYHAWSKKVLSGSNFSVDRIKRRFFSLMLAISFHFIGFAYLFHISYWENFDWNREVLTNVEVGTSSWNQALWYSVSNSFTRSYDAVRACTNLGDTISMIQVLFAFMFLTIIISTSVPQIKSK
jgi:hypothetical protein